MFNAVLFVVSLAVIIVPGAATLDSRQIPTHALYGCFKDSASSRFLIGPSFTSDTMTPQICNAWCAEREYRFSGVEYGRECFCDWTFTVYTDTPSTACTMPCAGDASQLCGGAGAIQVYSTDGVTYPTPVNGFPERGWSYAGCMTDDPANRTLARRVESGPILSSRICNRACQLAGLTFSGLEFGKECWCGNSVNSAATYANHFDCRMRCEGTPGEICGGVNRMDVYRW